MPGRVRRARDAKDIERDGTGRAGRTLDDDAVAQLHTDSGATFQSQSRTGIQREIVSNNTRGVPEGCSGFDRERGRPLEAVWLRAQSVPALATVAPE